MSLALCATAQQMRVQGTLPDLQASPVVTAVHDAANYVPWGYCHDDVQFSVGRGFEETMSAAILINRDDMGDYKNADILGIRFGLAAAAGGVSAFIKACDADNLSFDVENAKEEYVGEAGIGFTEVRFAAPFRTTSDYLIVGYTGTGTNFVGFDGGVTDADACYVNIGGQWGTVYETAIAQSWGSLSIQLLLGGEGMPETEMEMVEVLTTKVEQNRPFTLRGVVANMTNTEVTRYEIAWSANNGAETTAEFTTAIGAQERDTFAIEMPPFTAIGNNAVMVRIASVNGGPDSDAGNNVIVQSINCIEEGCFFPRTMVMEESTSVYCGYCPKGIVVMQSLSQRYPDDFIGIAIHSGSMGADPMTVYDYDEAINGLYLEDGLPNCILNRKYEYSGDPIYMDQWFEREMKFNSLAVADVELTSVSRIGEGGITVTTRTTFASDQLGVAYRLAFVLLENGVASSQPQLNYFSGGESMGGWENLPRMVDMPFNDVARGIWDFDGIEGSIPSDVVKKTPYEFTYTMLLGDKGAIVQDEDSLEVVALLIDPVTDEILNADKRPVGYVSGVASAPSVDEPVVYVADGSIKVDGGCDRLTVFGVSGVQVANRDLPRGIYVAVVERGGQRIVSKVLVR